MYNKVNHNVSYGVWMSIMYQCRFFNCNKCIALVGDVKKACGGIEGTLEISVYSPNFGANIKLPKTIVNF